MLILTLAIGNDYRKGLAKALESKRKYAEKHGYTYIQAGEEFWNRDRPIAWSKVPFLLHHLNKLPDGEFIWMSDGDVYITNHTIRIEDHVLPLLGDKDMLITHDACGHINSGNLLMRNSPWLRDYWKRVWEEEDCIYHIWWENAAMIKLMQRNENDRAHIVVTKEHKRFNAFIMGLPNEPLWQPGDFLVHFAGLYDIKKISDCIDEIDSGKVPRKDMYAP